MFRQKIQKLNRRHAYDRGKKRLRSISPIWLWLRVTYHSSRESAGRGGTVGGKLDALNTYDLEEYYGMRQSAIADGCRHALQFSKRVRARPRLKISRSSSGDSSGDQPKQHQQPAARNKNRHPNDDDINRLRLTQARKNVSLLRTV